MNNNDMLSIPRPDMKGQNIANSMPASPQTADGSLDQILTRIEKREIVAALHRADGQRTKAARMLGISRSRLYRRMEALGIDPRMVGTPEFT